MRPIVFLDIDDVIALDPNYSGKSVADYFSSENMSANFDIWERIFSADTRQNLAMLDNILNPYYVISSSWCRYINLDQMIHVFSRTGFEFVACNLHKKWRTPPLENFGRLSEIQAWVKKYRHGTQPFLIIDDYDSGWNLLDSEFDKQERVIFCEPSAGFDRNSLNKAVEYIQRQRDSIFK